MTETQTTQTETSSGDGGYSSAEKAYIESRGSAPIEEAPKTEGQAAETSQSETETGDEEVQVNGQGGERKFVPLKAVQEERRKNKELAERVRQMEIESARSAERLQLFERVYAKPQEQAAPPPKPEDDIFGAFNHTGQRVETLEQKLERMETEKKADDQRRAVLDLYRSDAARFGKETPDFGDAYAFAVSSRRKEYEAFGLAPQDVEKLIQEDEMKIVVHALQTRRSPAELIYAAAKARGFSGKQADTSAADKLSAIEKGQASNKSLSSAGGEAGADNMTATRLLAMSADDFLSYRSKHPDIVRKIMSGG